MIPVRQRAVRAVPCRVCQSTANRTDRYPIGKAPEMLISSVPSGKSPRQRSPTVRPTHQRSRDPRPPPRPTHRTSNAVISAVLFHVRNTSPTLDAEDRDLGAADLNGEGGGYVAGRYRDLLHAVYGISDHPAGDRAADLLTPQLLAIGGVDRIKVAAGVAKEHEASGGRSHGAEDRVIRLQPPLPDTRVGVDGVQPSGPVVVGARERSELVERIDGLLCRPRLSERGRHNFFPGLQSHRRAPVDVAGENQIGARIVGRAVPFLAASGAWAKMDILVGRKRLLDILDCRHRRLVEQLIVGEIEAIEETGLWRHRHQLLTACRPYQSGRVRNVPVVPIPRHNLEMTFVGAGLGVEDNHGVGKEVLALARADVEVRRRLAYGN